MGLTEEVREMVEREEKTMGQRDSVRSLEAFYQDLKKKGLVKPSRYTLPHPDTIGHSVPERGGASA
jgi:hypothetical protein